jgi:hypothetical protein
VSGGQSGADRAALDVALALGIAYGGWVPKGGWAEDYPSAPGVLGPYPACSESDSTDPDVRTARNVRDADATLVFAPASVTSGGTALTVRLATAERRPCLAVDPFSVGAIEEVRAFVRSLPGGCALNVAGPRASECTGIYEAVRDVLLACRRDLVGDPPTGSAPTSTPNETSTPN